MRAPFGVSLIVVSLLLAGCGEGADPGCVGAKATEPAKSAVRSITDEFHPKFFGDGNVRCSAAGLVRQGFGGTLDEYAEIHYLGVVKTEDSAFSIYYYDRNENHGSHAVLIFENGCEYIGAYGVNDKPIKVVGHNIMFDAPKRIGDRIAFSGISPPARVVIDGELSTFTR